MLRVEVPVRIIEKVRNVFWVFLLSLPMKKSKSALFTFDYIIIVSTRIIRCMWLFDRIQCLDTWDIYECILCKRPFTYNLPCKVWNQRKKINFSWKVSSELRLKFFCFRGASTEDFIQMFYNSCILQLSRRQSVFKVNTTRGLLCTLKFKTFHLLALTCIKFCSFWKTFPISSRRRLLD